MAISLQSIIKKPCWLEIVFLPSLIQKNNQPKDSFLIIFDF
jgi:hypothetical protein